MIEDGCHSTRPPPREFLYLPSLPLVGKKLLADWLHYLPYEGAL